ncbi:MAG: L-threonylcarbamoyladenylate synthase [Fibrobacterota bacterium]
MDNLGMKLKEGAIVRVETSSKVLFCASAYSALGIARIFHRSGTKLSESPVVYVNSRFDMLRLAEQFPEKAYQLSSLFWPGALDLRMNSSHEIPDILNDGNSSITANMPSCPELKKLLGDAGVPLAVCEMHQGDAAPAGSAEEIEYNIDCHLPEKSTLVSFTEDPDLPLLLREGEVRKAELEKAIGTLKEAKGLECEQHRPVRASRPITPIFVAETGSYTVSEEAGRGKIALITFGPDKEKTGYFQVKSLSSSGDIAEAAANFHNIMKEIDRLGLDAVILEPLPECELGTQLNERFRSVGVDVRKFGILMNQMCPD